MRVEREPTAHEYAYHRGVVGARCAHSWARAANVAAGILAEISEPLTVKGLEPLPPIANDSEFDRELHVALGIAQSIALALGDGEWPAGLEYGNAEELREFRESLEALESRLYGSDR